jgi:hypothetical protein
MFMKFFPQYRDSFSSVFIIECKGCIHLSHLHILQVPCLQTLSDSLQARDDENTRLILEDLIELAALDCSLLRAVMDQTLAASLSACADESVCDELRFTFLELFLTICESKPALARKVPGLVDRALPVLIRMMVCREVDPQEWAQNVGDAEEEDKEEQSVCYGEEALERLLSSIGGNRVVPVTLSLLPASLQSTEWAQRAAAYRAMVVLVSGADKALRPNLAMLTQWSVTGLRDPHCCVQHAAAGAVAALCTCFGPDVQAAHHAEILPALIQLLEPSVLPRLRSRAAKVCISHPRQRPRELTAGGADRVLS